MKNFYTKSERLQRRRRSRIIKSILIVLGIGVIVVQVLFLVGVIPMPKALRKEENAIVDSVFGVENAFTEPESVIATAPELGNTYMKYVFVGDSRYVGMSSLKQDGDVFLAKNGMGYDYLIEQIPNINAVCDQNAALIIGLGVNDVNYASDKYIAKINELADQLNCQVYYMSVNPVDEKKEEANGYSIANDKIDAFNTKLKAGLSSKIKYIDTNSYLKMMTFTTVDGLHYNDGTYKLIYDYIKANL